MKITGILLAFLLISLSIFSISPFHVNVNAQSPLSPPFVRQMCYAQQATSAGGTISCTISSGIQAGDLFFIWLVGSASCTSTVTDTISTYYNYVYNCFQPVTTTWTGVAPTSGGDTITVTTQSSQINPNGLGLFVFDIGNLIYYLSYESMYQQPPLNTGTASEGFAMNNPINIPPYSLAIGDTSVQITGVTSCSGISVSTVLTYPGTGTGCYMSGTNVVVYADSYNQYTNVGGTVQSLSSVSISSGTFTTGNGATNSVFIVENTAFSQNQPPTCTQCPNSGGGSGQSGNAGLGINYFIPIALSNTESISTPSNLS